MRIRAVRDTCINVPDKGLVFLRGPYTEDDGSFVDGEQAEVDDSFVVNPDVFEVVVAPARCRVSYVQPVPFVPNIPKVSE
jgi:hypothetical protein